MLKAGFNTHALNLSNSKALEDWVVKNHPNTMLALNDHNYASKLADLGVPNVILRMTNNDDSIHNKLRSFGEWWNSVKPNYEDRRLIVHFGNEPKGNYGLLSTLSVDGMHILHNEGYRGIFGNFATGNPELVDWQTTLKPMLQGLVTYRDEHFLGIHEYLMGELDWNVPYEIGRYQLLLAGLPIQIILTEFGTDVIEDVKSHHPEAGSTRGFRDYNNEDLVYSRIKQAFDEFYNPDDRVKGVNFFCYGNSGGWTTYNAENSGMLDKFAGLVKRDTVTQFNQEVIIQKKGETGVRRRTGASLSAPISGQVTSPVVVTKLAVDGDWTQYRFPDGIFWCNTALILEQVAGSTVAINLYNAPQEDIDKANNLFKQLLDLLKKYNADIT